MGFSLGYQQPLDEPNAFFESFLDAPGAGIEGMYANMVESFEANEDNTVFTFTLREGMRWSDGVPLTTEDVRFTYEDVLLNEEITPVFPATYRAGGSPDGSPMTVEIVDDYTFQVSFDEPYGAFLAELTYYNVDYGNLLKPSHYLKNYHIDYTELEALLPELEEEEFDEHEWYRLFTTRDASGNYGPNAIGFPTLRAWKRVESPSGQMRLNRNPFYFKVDTEGRQLPYIDSIDSTLASDMQMIQMQILTGEVDFFRGETALADMALYRENEERGSFRTLLLDFHVTPVAMSLNYTYEDDVWREVVRDLRFRQALNYAIDRDEVIDSIYFGFATPPEVVPGDYDPDRANALLDEMGMDQRDSDGYRLSPGGERFELVFELDAFSADAIALAELLVDYFEDIGIRTPMQQISGSLKWTRGSANELMATMWWLHTPQWTFGWKDYLPTIGENWCPLWATWYTSGGTAGEEPEPLGKELFRIHEDLVAALPGSAAHDQASEELFAWLNDYMPFIIPVENVPTPVIVSADFGNIPESGWEVAVTNSGEQFFFRR